MLFSSSVLFSPSSTSVSHIHPCFNSFSLCLRPVANCNEHPEPTWQPDNTVYPQTPICCRCASFAVWYQIKTSQADNRNRSKFLGQSQIEIVLSPSSRNIPQFLVWPSSTWNNTRRRGFMTWSPPPLSARPSFLCCPWENPINHLISQMFCLYNTPWMYSRLLFSWVIVSAPQYVK